MSKILLITDVARIGKIFGQLAVDNSVQVSIANNLEQGGKILAAETPDAVYVQTHLSGLSTDILLLHLKNQLGSNTTSFFLLATPSQVNNTILAPFQGWLDTSTEDEQVYRSLILQLSRIIANWNRNNFANNDLLAATALQPPPVAPKDNDTGNQPAVKPKPASDLSGQALPVSPSDSTPSQEPATSYPPRARLSVYSEFNNSFDNAVNGAPEPEPLDRSAPPDVDSWIIGHQEAPAAPRRSKRRTFMLWLVPVVGVAIAFTMVQHFGVDKIRSVMPETLRNVLLPEKNATPALNNHSTSARAKKTQKPVSSALKPSSGADPSTPGNAKASGPVSPGAVSRPAKLPEFIALSKPDKSYSGSNPGWERYESDTMEYRVYREQGGIKAIQVIAGRGGNEIGGSFLLDAFKQLGIKGNFIAEASETKEDFKIERSYNTDNIRITYYRNKQDSRLQAVVITWK